MQKITEQPSHFDHLELMSIGELLQHINEEGVIEQIFAGKQVKTKEHAEQILNA